MVAVFTLFFFGLLLLGVWSVLVEPRLLVIKSIILQTPKWPESRKPLRVAVLGDLHVGAPHVSLRKLEKIVSRVNALEADIVALLGDFIPHVFLGKPVAPEAMAERLAKLTPKSGVAVVLGGHDEDDGGKPIRDALEKVGAAVLENQSKHFQTEDGSIWIAGLSDYHLQQPEVEKALEKVPTDSPVLLLSHDPANFQNVPDDVLVTLSGHTHGGQIRVPFYGALYIPSKAPLRHSYGYVHEDGKDLVVTGGVGTSVLPIRFNMPPEIVLLTIVNKPTKGTVI